MNLFVLSYYFSVVFQIISFLIQLYGLQQPITPQLIPLSYSLQVEFYVSIVELIVYLWIGTNLVNFKSVMNKRYLDWFITTNFLLISIALLFIYFNQRQNEKDLIEIEKKNNANELLIKNIPKFTPILIYNNLMLIIGYLGEIQKIPKVFSTSIGFLFFFLSFYYLYDLFAKYSKSGIFVFYILALIWGLYGVSHTFSLELKNISYNILDLISKNIFGVFLVYMILHPNSV